MIQWTRWPYTSEEVGIVIGRLTLIYNISDESFKINLQSTSPPTGFLGLIVAPFLRIDGVFYNSEALNMLLFNFVGAIVLIAYYGIVSAILFFLLSR